MAGKVKMYNKDLDAFYEAPEGSIDHYEERGWLVVEEDPEETAKAGQPRVRKTVSPRAEKAKAAAKKN